MGAIYQINQGCQADISVKAIEVARPSFPKLNKSEKDLRYADNYKFI